MQEAVYSWQSVLDEPLRSRVLEVVRVVAERLGDPDQVLAIAQLATQQTRLSAGGWSAASLASGFGSTALFFHFMTRCFPGQNWEGVARQHLRLAAEGTHNYPLVIPALFGGSSGLAAVVSLFNRIDSRYQKTMHTLNSQLATQVLERRWQRESQDGVAASEYDVILGASGILGYLVTIAQPDEHIHAAAHKLLEYLIWLADNDDTVERKRWFIPPELYPTSLQWESYPDGYFNCGLAHGIPGPLAALAVAWHAGYRLPGQLEAMLSLGHWIVEQRICDAWGVNWPNGVPLQQSNSAANASQDQPARAGWCYGTPGVARALWLAGTALNDTGFCQTALEAIESVVQRPTAARRIDSVTFCHGVAGLLAICLRFVHETGSELVCQQIPLLVQQMLDGFDPSYPLGFRDLEIENNWIDNPGLLTGAAGVALALLAASTSIEPHWDRLFLIS